LLSPCFIIRRQISLDFLGVIISIRQRIMHVGRPQMGILLYDLFYGHPLTVPSEDEAHSDTRAGHHGPTSTTARNLFDIAKIDLGHGQFPHGSSN
jgi:hypothetical protein